MNRLLASFILSLLLMSQLSAVLPFQSTAQSIPIGSCPLTGNQNVTTPLLIVNLACTHSGNINIYGNGSLTLVNTSLIQNANGTGFSILALGGAGRLVMIDSSLIFSNGAGALQLTGNSSMSLVHSFSLINGSVIVANGARFASNQSSIVNASSLVSSGVTNVALNSTILAIKGASVLIEGQTLKVNNSTLYFSNMKTTALSGQNTSIANSYISYSNVSNVFIGNSSTTTIVGSAIQLSNVANVTIGSPLPLFISSTVSVSASVLSLRNYGSNSSMRIFGRATLGLLNSSISTDVASGALQPLSNTTFIGGNVTVLGSQVFSSSRESYGYTPNSLAIVKINSSGNLNIERSSIVAGRTEDLSVLKSSQLVLSSQKNITIESSLLQSASWGPNLNISANVPNIVQSITLNRTLVETQNSTGASPIFVLSSYAIVLDHSRIDALQTPLKVSTYSIWSSGSTLVTKNITSSMIIGSTVSVGTFYNTTFTPCASAPCLLAPVHSGRYSIYGFLFAHVVSKSTSQPVAFASVFATETRTGLSSVTGFTNGTGWAVLPTLLYQANSSKSVSRPNYIVQALSGSKFSPEVLVKSNNTFYSNLVIDTLTNLTTVDLTSKSPNDISQMYNMANYTNTVAPPNLYAVGQYLGNQYVPYATIISNAVPLSCRNNASNNEIDFATVGITGSTFYFAVIYPKNITTLPMKVSIDGFSSSSVRLESNSTHYFSIFYVSSGLHQISLVYSPPNGSYSSIPADYPEFFPTTGTILVVVLLAAIGIVFIVIFVRRNDKGPAAS